MDFPEGTIFREEINPKTGQKIKFNQKILLNSSTLGGKDLIFEAVVILDSENEVQILDPVNYKTIDLIKPKNFDSHKKYPVLIYIYGGPYSQIVIKKYRSLWHHLMAQKGFIVFSMDFRGSDNRGKEWSRVVDKQLGTAEFEDLLTGVEYIRSLDYVDPDRIGIWGWSYGGYMVLYALTHTDRGLQNIWLPLDLQVSACFLSENRFQIFCIKPTDPCGRYRMAITNMAPKMSIYISANLVIKNSSR